MSTHTTHTKVTSSKRRGKKSRKTQNTTEEVNSGPCHLARVPIEIISEILSHKCSPRDILSLARCSKYFCNTLVQPSSASIWKKARARCLPTPIPDPLPNFTEASYASFLFDGGECEVCLSFIAPYFANKLVFNVVWFYRFVKIRLRNRIHRIPFVFDYAKRYGYNFRIAPFSSH